MPLTGEIVETNGALDATPELVNQDPYGQGWMIAIRFDEPSELDGFLDAEAYGEHLATEANA